MSASADMIPVAVIAGDGIGPEITLAVQRILDAAAAGIEWIPCAAGGAVFARGDRSGLPLDTVQTIRRCGVALKAPLATPLGGGERSANVTMRETLGTFAAVRPVKTLAGLAPHGQGAPVDLILVRENFEDLYIGVEYDLGDGVAVALKVSSERNIRAICEAAFSLARVGGRRRVTGISKSNILKMTDGLFDRVFDAVAARHPDLQAERMLVDAAACRLVQDPGRFDVIVTSNLYGDILSDLTAGLGGGLGVCPSINLGEDVAIFEAVHGSAPDIAGKGIANPTALLRAAILMLDHVGRHGTAGQVEAALASVLGAGAVRTGDLPGNNKPVGTAAFADAVIAALSEVEPQAGRLCWRRPVPGGEPTQGWEPENLRQFVRQRLSANA